MNEHSWRELVGEERPVGFDQVAIGVASSDTMRSWSKGEVKNPETINYRTFKPEKGGLFCERIFGPTRDWECSCGKYKRFKHKGVICDRCGVEVTLARVRRERMGHIELAVPVSHIWFYKCMPSRLGLMLDMSARQLERVIYYEDYIVVDPGQTPLQKTQLLNEVEFREAQEQYGEGFNAGMGAEAVKKLLAEIDLHKLNKELEQAMGNTKSKQIRKKLAKRLKLVQGFISSHARPEWMVLEVLPVIPPDLRPLVPLEGGRFATSDLNDLYRRVINRNNRLKNLLQLKTPEVIIRNEKRMLQEAVDALFDNGRHGRAVTGAGNRPLKSLSDMLKGKGGRFRQNLLGKRVDYSGRSVIVIGPELRLHQCGLPKHMALELFKPFIYNKLEERGYTTTIKSAKKLVEKERPEVWDILDEVTREHPVLLNRAPTLHRLGIQAFDPVLVEGKAIRIHPLVCTAFNADFDGDQMAVDIPLSHKARAEALVLMLSSQNILSPANGQPTVVPTQDIVLGIYYLTKEKRTARGAGRVFGDFDEVLMAHATGDVGILAPVRVRYTGELIDLTTQYDDQALLDASTQSVENRLIVTTVGRVLFNTHLPEGMPYINGLMKRKGLGQLVTFCYLRWGNEKTVDLVDRLKDLGFLYATKAGISIGIDDMVIPDNKQALVDQARRDQIQMEQQYLDGVITNGERYNKVIALWQEVTEKVSEAMFKQMEQIDHSGGEFNSIFMMADSGARGSKQQMRQLAGMRGLMSKPSGEVIETPITANFREGLSVLQYFISTHGARKGLADTALKTADSGYLTRRLVDVAQDVIVTEQDCNTFDGITVTPIMEGGDILEPLRDRIVGRVSQEDVYDPIAGDLLVSQNDEITDDLANAIQEAGIEQVKIRSVLTCETRRGVCRRCYGRNLASGKLVEIGEAVGVIAAESIGEPGTQLTMRTFHVGGTASRVSEQSKHEATNPGRVEFVNVSTVTNKNGDLVVINRNGKLIIVEDTLAKKATKKALAQPETHREKERYALVYGSTLKVHDGQHVEAGQPLVEWDPFTSAILTEVGGKVVFKDIVEGENVREETDRVTGLTQMVIVESATAEKRTPTITVKTKKGGDERKYLLPTGAHLMVQSGVEVYPGDIIAKIPRATTKTKDITGGLPRVVELFEARHPRDKAIISEVDGTVHHGPVVKGMRRVIVETDEGTRHEYSVPRSVHVNVQETERVRAGDPLIDGPIDPHDVLSVLGIKELQRYLVDKIQEVYRSQSVAINDKHIEVICRQMLRSVRVTRVGDTDFLVDEQVDRFRFMEENEKVMNRGGEPADGTPLLLGITKASPSTESFGRLIPAGTGMPAYRDIYMEKEEPAPAPTLEELLRPEDEEALSLADFEDEQ